MLTLALAMTATGALADAPADGSYTDFGSGRNDFIYVTTTFKDGKIQNVEIGDNKETPTIAWVLIRK